MMNVSTVRSKAKSGVINRQLASFQKTHSPDPRIKEVLPRSLKVLFLSM